MKIFKFISLFFILALLLESIAYSQSSNIFEFLPLQVGNVWVYQCSAYGNQPCYCNKIFRVTLVGTTNINGKTYFQSQISNIIIACPSSCGGGMIPFNSYLRVDSVSGKVLSYTSGTGCNGTPNEIMHDSLKSHIHDTIWQSCVPPGQWNTYTCIDTNSVTIFGASRSARSFGLQGFESSWGRAYVKGIGITGANLMSIGCQDQTHLLGCVINGVVYGDTGFIVGVNQLSSEIPKEFSLSQNYPNPFNPNTVIKFQVAGDKFVTLKIFDVQGKEVASLVNEQLNPGTYEADWDGTEYPSGVYFYQLSVDGGQLATKKMVLLK